MERQLVVDIRIETPAVCERSEAEQQVVQDAGGHVRGYAVRITSAIAPARWCQDSASAARCVRPAVVRE